VTLRSPATQAVMAFPATQAVMAFPATQAVVTARSLALAHSQPYGPLRE
jgi:hypothetical protein